MTKNNVFNSVEEIKLYLEQYNDLREERNLCKERFAQLQREFNCIVNKNGGTYKERKVENIFKEITDTYVEICDYEEKMAEIEVFIESEFNDSLFDFVCYKYILNENSNHVEDEYVQPILEERFKEITKKWSYTEEFQKKVETRLENGLVNLY
jgi:ribosome-associated toxin RatA of RatAB toxin-antitoxin module